MFHSSLSRFALLAGLMSAALPFAPAAAAAPAAAQSDAGYYRMKLGAFTIVALSDGNFDLPTGQLLIEDKPGAVQSLLASAGLPGAVPTSVNAFLIDTGRKRILVDAGSGALLGPSLGKVLGNLRSAGYAPEQIDEVLLTHLHLDHVGGLAHDGKAVFANAVIRVDREEADFWQDKANTPKVDDSVKGSFDGAIASLAPYAATGRLRPFDAGATIEPGITAVAMKGHTPGHTVFRVQSGGRTMMIWGDIVHVAAVQFPDPKVTILFDSTPAQAEATREAAYADAARKGYLVAAAHIAFPGIGRVKAEGAGYAWQPAGRATR